MRAVLLLALGGCWLERVTGEPEPLDPRFYEDVERAQGEPGVGGGSAVPFGDVDGPKVRVSGVVESDSPEPVAIDVRVPDPTKPGGVDGKGKLLLDAPGPFELAVPRNLGALELQAFQDPDDDGPGGMDPFAAERLNVAGEDVSGLVLHLVPGARGSGGPEHHEAPPGAPGGGTPADAPAPPPGPGAGPGSDVPFADYDGRTVKISGVLRWEPGGEAAPEGAGGVVVDLDLFQPDAGAPGGRRMLGKLKVAPGPWSVELPEDFGPVLFEAFIDRAGDGPSPGDPMGAYAGNPLVVGRSDVSGVDIELAVRPDGRMPEGAPQGRPPGRRPGI